MKKLIIISLLVITGILFAVQIKRGFLSILILVDSIRPPEKTLMGRFFGNPLVSKVLIPKRNSTISADLYAPKGKGKFFPLLLIHGADSLGNKNEQVVQLANNLARAGFLVLVPDLEGVKTFHIRIGDAEDVLQSFQYLSSHGHAAGRGGGMIGMSFGTGPMLLAAADSRIRDKLRLLVTFDGYYDLRNVMLFGMTGVYEYGRYHGMIRPDASVSWMLAYRNLDLLPSLEDRNMLRRIIEKRNRYEIADADTLAKSLHAEGRAVYAFLLNNDAKLFPLRYEKLPHRVREYVYQLSPSRAIAYINAYCIIIHAMDDDLVPYTESIRLADTVGNHGRAHLVLLPQFMHWESVEPSVGDWSKRYVLGGWRFFAAIYDMIEQSQ